MGPVRLSLVPHHANVRIARLVATSVCRLSDLDDELTDDAVRDMQTVMTLDPSRVERVSAMLVQSGYWTPARKPQTASRAFDSALRACMLDPACN